MRYVMLVTLGGGLAWAAYYLVGAAVDNRLGILIGRDIREVQSRVAGGKTVDEIVRELYGECDWTGYHPEEVWRTFVTCRVKDGPSFHWELNRDYSPKDRKPTKGVFVTALTQRTATLTPELAPEGVNLAYLPEDQPNVRATVLFQRAALYGSKAPKGGESSPSGERRD